MNFKPQWRHCSWNNVPPTTPEDSFSSLVETILPTKWRKKSFFSSSFHLIEIEEERRSQDSQPKSFMTNRVEHKSQDEIMISTGNTHTHVQRSSSSFTLTFWATNTDESRTTNNKKSGQKAALGENEVEFIIIPERHWLWVRFFRFTWFHSIFFFVLWFLSSILAPKCNISCENGHWITSGWMRRIIELLWWGKKQKMKKKRTLAF